jgi:hypothetical protein
MIKERADHGGVEILERELGRLLAGALAGEAEQQPNRVAIGGDRVRAGVSFADETVREEPLDRSGEGDHHGCPIDRSSRLAANAISSGAASRYQ